MIKRIYKQPATVVVKPAASLMEVITISGWVDDPGQMEAKPGDTDDDSADFTENTSYNAWEDDKL